MNGKIVKERLRVRLQGGGRSLDRSINFVIGEVDPTELVGLRGAVFPAKDKWDVNRQMTELKEMATNAAREGRVEQFLEELDNVGRGKPLSPTVAEPTFAEYAKEWMEVALQADSVTESERESATSILKLHLVPFFGTFRLTAISPRLVDRYKVAKRGEVHGSRTGYSAKTINNQLSVLRRVLARAVEHEVIDRMPLSPKMWAKTEKPEPDGNWLTPEDEDALIRWLWAQPDDPTGRHLALLLQLVCGLRFGELRAVEKVDLEVAARNLIVRRSQARKVTGPPKNKRTRPQPVPEDLVQRLRRHILATEGQRLFTGDRGGPLSNNVLNRALRAACRAAGVPEVSSHGLRRTAGSRYGYMGQSQRAIADMLGHNDLKATERYVRFHADHRHELVERRWAAAGTRTENDEAPTEAPIGT
jgi:integrase